MPKPKPHTGKKTNPVLSKKPLKLNNYIFDIATIDSKTLKIYSLHSEKNKSYTALSETIYKIKKMAKENGYKEIKGNTWIFAEHPKIAEKLGVTLDYKAIIEFNKFKIENNIIKILGIHRTLIKKDLLSKNKTKGIIIKESIKKEINSNTLKSIMENQLTSGNLTLLNCIVKTKQGLKETAIVAPYDLVLIPFTIKL